MKGKTKHTRDRMLPDADKHITLTVTREEEGQRFDKWLSKQVPDLSRSRIKALALEGHITLDDGPVASLSKAVRNGQIATIALPEPRSAEPLPENITLSIAFEDDSLIVIDKPAGMVVHPAPGAETGTLVNALLYHCGNSLSGIGGVARPGIVHRIDKDTSGLLVVAKTDQAHAGLAKQFEAHTVKRRYKAITYNAPKPSKGLIKTQIGRHPVDRKKMAVLEEGKGRHAVTHYQTLRQFHFDDKIFASEVVCELETGRTHQVRVHMAHLLCPLIGDPVYAKRRRVDSARYPALAQQIARFNRQALHAETLGFIHPVSGEALNFTSELPYDYQALVECLASNQVSK